MALITSRRFRQQHQLMTIDFFCDVSAKRKRWHLQPGWSQRSSSCRPWTFLYGRCNCIAKFGCCHDMLSVCLSVVCDASVTAFGKTNARYLFQPELASFKERFFCTLACLIHTTDTDKLRLFYPVLSCWWCEQNWLQDKTVFSSPHRISRLYKTGSKFSVADSLDLSPIRSTPLTRTRQDSLVLYVWAVWTMLYTAQTWTLLLMTWTLSTHSAWNLKKCDIFSSSYGTNTSCGFVCIMFTVFAIVICSKLLLTYLLTYSHRCKNVFLCFYNSLKNMFFYVFGSLMFLCMFKKMFYKSVKNMFFVFFICKLMI